MKLRITILAALIVLIPGVVKSAAIKADEAKTLTADKIEYNARDQSITTSGGTSISNVSGQNITLRDSYLSGSGAGAISGKDIEMHLSPQIFITAENITRIGEVADARHAMYTACYGCDESGNAWEISASRIKHDNEKHNIKFSNPVLRVYGVPVFWFPKIVYPDPSIHHKSGFLIPDFNSTNNMGTQINIPFYISISDTHDLTVTGSYLTNENPLWQLEHRLNASHMEFRTVGSFTHNQDGENRWHVFNNDIIEMGEHVRTTIFFERASDNTYLQKYGFYKAQPYLDSGLRTEIFAESGYATVEAHVFQELRSIYNNQANPSGNILPQVHGVYQSGRIFGNTYLSFMGDMLGVQNDKQGTAAQRIVGQASAVSPWTIWGGQRVTAGISARYDVYNFKNTDMLDGNMEFSGMENRFLPSGYLEWALPFAKSGENWTQTVQPRARITFMDRQSESAYAVSNDSAGALLSDATLFSNNRFSGYDLWENGTYMDYGISWSAFSGMGKSVEVFVGQSYDFATQEDIDPNSGFNKGFSDYVGRFYYDDNDLFGISSRFRMSENDFNLRHLETVAKIGSRNYISAGHIWARQFDETYATDSTINEITGGLGIHLTERFTARFNAIYNITDRQFQGHNGGIYYDHPCYTLGLEYARDNAIKEDYVGNTKFRFQFALKINGNEKTFLEQEYVFGGINGTALNGEPFSPDEKFANF